MGLRAADVERRSLERQMGSARIDGWVKLVYKGGVYLLTVMSALSVAGELALDAAESSSFTSVNCGLFTRKKPRPPGPTPA
jgi:hypothetical protein